VTYLAPRLEHLSCPVEICLRASGEHKQRTARRGLETAQNWRIDEANALRQAPPDVRHGVRPDRRHFDEQRTGLHSGHGIVPPEQDVGHSCRVTQHRDDKLRIGDSSRR
jgi:hypothetical protein